MVTQIHINRARVNRVKMSATMCDDNPGKWTLDQETSAYH